MPHSNWGFTPINRRKSPPESELAAPTQPSQQNQAARRRRKNPLIQKYLSPGKSASASMFERAAISHGEEPQVKKRKTIKHSEGDGKNHGATGNQARPKPNTSGRRVVSEGMRTSKPFAFSPIKPNHPTFNPRSAADKVVASSGINDQRPESISKDTPASSNAFKSIIGDTISVVSPLTSMDIISAHPTSSSTLENVSASQQTSCDGLQDYKATNENGRSPADRSDNAGDLQAKYSNHPLGHLFSSTTQSQHIPNHQRVHRLARNPQLGTIVEEAESDALPATHDNDGKCSISPPANYLKTIEDISDGFDMFDDGLSDTDLLCLVDANEIQLPQKDECGLSTSKFAARGYADEGCPQAVDYLDMDGFFAEDLELSEDENVNAMEAADASIGTATILNQVSSNIQKIQATPTTLFSSCAEAQNAQSPEHKPVLRPPFPDRAQERSPILGLSGATSLRVCFRIGEALNVGIQAVRERQSVVIELYARVRWAFREPRSVKQHFIFMDLYHDRPPYLDGTYDGWKGVELYEHDSGRFLERSDRPLTCRCVGKLKRDGKSWRLVIASIWEASIDDVEHVLRVIQS
ncbi:uncharacterized protein BKCO1_1000053 [Diplodia corticola]|uniref:Sequence orphan n=1 Tax=Diplodia corticola TaxID=236234 RepID=A0A1J9R934_9PEZI|nr:uncharacterized protein BKCO1_1000053 [Diplodia corticola]OJD36698.1 sequence orphan [Diplodia corticola]